MDTLTNYRRIIQKKLNDLTKVPYAHGEIDIETVFDQNTDRYLVMLVRRANDRRVHGCLAHVDIINDKLWIQRDGTEHGIANDFVESGIPKDRIVLGFRSPRVRQDTEFAVA